MTSFNIAMGRAYFSAEERDAGYCQLFVESLAGPALTWFSRLTADSISTFKELSTEFLKHYSMYIRQGASATDLWKIAQGQKESLQDFMERFKNLVSKVDVPDKTAVEALRNALWIRSSFRSDLYTPTAQLLWRTPSTEPIVSYGWKRITRLIQQSRTR